jgi:spore coat protein U-like protein
MKKLIFCLFILAVNVYYAGISYAGTKTSTLDLSVTVIDACTIISTAPVSFPDYDGSTAVTALGDVTVNCSPEVLYDIAFDAGLNYDPTESFRKLADDSGNVLNYTLEEPGTGSVLGDNGGCGEGTFTGTSLNDTGSGTDQPHDVQGIISAGQQAPAGPSTYNDTVGVTVCW